MRCFAWIIVSFVWLIIEVGLGWNHPHDFLTSSKTLSSDWYWLGCFSFIGFCLVLMKHLNKSSRNINHKGPHYVYLKQHFWLRLSLQVFTNLLTMLEWEEGDRMSFDDSDRFEEDSLCSWGSEPESLCNNWRGWKKPSTALGPPVLASNQRRTEGKATLIPIALCYF